jgi:hypothetical protein
MGGALSQGVLGRERVGLGARISFWALLAVSWMVMVAHMWDALTALPTAERLEETRLTAIPTPRLFFFAVGRSAVEILVTLGVLWPWRPRYYLGRLAGVMVALGIWFFATIPMGLSQMAWVHRRWLFFLVLATAGALAVGLGYRLVRTAVERIR